MVFKRVGQLWKSVNPFAGVKRQWEEPPAQAHADEQRTPAKRTRMSEPEQTPQRGTNAPERAKIERDRAVTLRVANAKPPSKRAVGIGAKTQEARGGGFPVGDSSMVRTRVGFGQRGAAETPKEGVEKNAGRSEFPFVPAGRRWQDEGPSSLVLSPMQRLVPQNKDDALHRLANFDQKHKPSKGVKYDQVGYVPQEVQRSKALHCGGGPYETPVRQSYPNKQRAKPRPGPEEHRFTPGKLPASVAESAAFEFKGRETHGDAGSHLRRNSPQLQTPRIAMSRGERKGVGGPRDGHVDRSQVRRVPYLGEQSKSPPMGCMLEKHNGIGRISDELAVRGEMQQGFRANEFRASSSHRRLQQGSVSGKSEREGGKEGGEQELVNSFKSIDLRDQYSKHAKTAMQKFEDVEKEREREKKVIRQSPGLSIHELELIEKEANFARATAVHMTPRAKSPIQSWQEFQASIPPPREPDDDISESVSEIATEDINDEEFTSLQNDGVVDVGDEGPRRFGVQLTDADYEVFDDVVTKPDGRVLSEVDNVELTAKMLACLKHGEWLNDEVMNGYMRLMQERDASRRVSGKGPRCHFHKSFFMNRLFLDGNSYCYKNVQRWTKPQKLKNWGQQSQSILDCDIVFFPVHLHMHWVLAYALMGENKIVYCDSLQGKRPNVVQAICRYLKDEAMDKKGENWDMGEWEHVYSETIPRQMNGCDCGVFSLMYAKSRSEVSKWKDDWGFNQASMPALRVGMLKEFLQKKLL